MSTGLSDSSFELGYKCNNTYYTAKWFVPFARSHVVKSLGFRRRTNKTIAPGV